MTSLPAKFTYLKATQCCCSIRSRDVLHAVYMPHFRVQMYAVPGMPTSSGSRLPRRLMRCGPRLGNPNFNYELACNQICGRGHFAMKMLRLSWTSQMIT